MADNRRRKKSKGSRTDVVGGKWLPNLLTWGGVLLMLTGGIIAYPVLHDYLAPPDAESLGFSAALAPDATTLALSPPPMILPETEILVTSEGVAEPEAPAETPLTSEDEIKPGEPTATLVVPEEGAESEDQTEAQPTPEATPTPTPPPTPAPTLDPASLVPTRLVIPAIDLDAPIVEVGWETQEINGQLVSSWIVPDTFAAGWHQNSAPPGQVGNTVLNGHHNIHGQVFRDLVDLEAEDELTLYAGETAHYYVVTELYILKEKGEPVEVRLENAKWILPTDDERLTMVTCWPYTNNTHRLIVVARLIEPTESVLRSGQTE